MIDRTKYNVIDVVRCYFTDTSTTGRLFVNDEFMCYTLEPPFYRDVKPYAIPYGIYDVTLKVQSPKYRYRSPYSQFGGRVPRLLDVPNFKGILIHIGNFPRDTKGCILVGARWNVCHDRLFDSTKAYLALWYRLSSFKYPIKIRISNYENSLGRSVLLH